MANLSQFMAGGKLRYQLFTSSGTFTPSAKLLANGGQVFLEMAGGGGAGAAEYTWGSIYNVGGGGGSSFLKTATTVLAPVTVIIGAGGQAGRSGSDSFGLNAIAPGDGGNTSFGSVVCYGGRKGAGWRGGASGSQGQPGFNGIHVSASFLQDGNGGGSGGGGAGRLSGEANTGGGGAGANGLSVYSGAGGSGYCLVYWFE